MDHTLLQSVRAVDLTAEAVAAAEASLATEKARHAKDPEKCPRTLFKSAGMGLWTKLRPCVPIPRQNSCALFCLRLIAGTKDERAPAASQGDQMPQTHRNSITLSTQSMQTL
jgi:hypothetical protein